MCSSRHCTDIVINVFGFEMLCYYKTESVLPINYSMHGIINKEKEILKTDLFYLFLWICLFAAFFCSKLQSSTTLDSFLNQWKLRIFFCLFSFQRDEKHHTVFCRGFQLENVLLCRFVYIEKKTPMTWPSKQDLQCKIWSSDP